MDPSCCTRACSHPHNCFLAPLPAARCEEELSSCTVLDIVKFCFGAAERYRVLLLTVTVQQVFAPEHQTSTGCTHHLRNQRLGPSLVFRPSCHCTSQLPSDGRSQDVLVCRRHLANPDSILSPHGKLLVQALHEESGFSLICDRTSVLTTPQLSVRCQPIFQDGVSRETPSTVPTLHCTIRELKLSVV